MTYVLIHGGGATARFWDRLVPHLGRPVLAVDLPGRGDKPADLATLSVEDEVESVLGDVAASASSGGLVIVAHSSGGLVVPGVVTALAGRVEHIVLNAALVPPEGGRGIDCMQTRHADGLRRAVGEANEKGRVITLSGPPDDPESYRTAYGGDPLDDETLEFITDPVRCVRDTVHHYFQPVEWSTVAEVPVTYLVNERDRPIPATLQNEMVERLSSMLTTSPTVVCLDSGHIPAVTAPGVFAEALTNAVSSSA